MRVAISDDDLARLLLIRAFEQALLELFTKGLLNGTTHTCLGQEYVPVSLRTSLGEGDFIFSNHRGHGHYLARYDDPEGLLAEIMGRVGAVCGGVGGSQHIYRGGRFLSTGVQGESIPVAAGVALHFKRRGLPSIAAAYIGDGTWGEGSVYEGLNMACLWGLPLVVLVENNGIAQSTASSLQLSGTIRARAEAFGARHLSITTDELEEIRLQVDPAIAATRGGAGPLVIEFFTNRIGPHSKGDDTRAPEILEALRRRDWLFDYRATHGEQATRLEREASARVAAIVADVRERGPSSWEGP